MSKRELNRRDFLATMGGVVAAAFVVPSIAGPFSAYAREFQIHNVYNECDAHGGFLVPQGFIDEFVEMARAENYVKQFFMNGAQPPWDVGGEKSESSRNDHSMKMWEPLEHGSRLSFQGKTKRK